MAHEWLSPQITLRVFVLSDNFLYILSMEKLEKVAKILFFILKDVLGTIAWFIVSWYGIKYLFVAGPIYFGNPAGYLVATFVMAFYLTPFVKKFLDKIL
jgi:hypothetical protein